MSYSIQCIHCKAVLKSKVAAPAGKKVKCPRCQQMFTTGAASQTLPDPAPPPSAQSAALAEDDDEVARAIAKLEAEQTFGKKPAPAETKPAAAAQPVVPAPATNTALSEEDEIDAAIAKLEAEQTFGPKPAAGETKLAPVVETALKVTAAPDDAIPQIDNDLVVPDDEESTSERKHRKSSDQPSSKKISHADEDDDELQSEKKRRRDVEYEEEHLKKKKSRDEDDDEPRSKKKKGRGDAEDEDEVRSQNKRNVDEDDEAFMDKPQSKKAKSRAEDEDDDAPRSKKKARDDDDEDEDDGPRRIDKKKKKAGSPMMLILLIGGAFLGLFACCGCGIGGYFLFGFGRSDIVGRWENTDVIRIVYEFRADGTGKMEGLGIETHFNYSLNGSELTLTNTRVKVGAMEVPGKDAVQVRFRVIREGDTLRFEDYNGRHGARLTLRKIN